MPFLIVKPKKTHSCLIVFQHSKASDLHISKIQANSIQDRFANYTSLDNGADNASINLM